MWRQIPRVTSVLRRYQSSLPRNTVFMLVPQQQVWVVERFGSFHRFLAPGLQVLMPLVDRVAYVASLKEQAVDVSAQTAITYDNVYVRISGVLFYRVEDPYKYAYGVENPDFAIRQIAQTTMRVEIGRLTLDRCLNERVQMNKNIVAAVNEAASDWGIVCLRHEIRDIEPPSEIIEAMHSQVSAERKKRALILESEGTRQAAINVAEGNKQAAILASEADRQKRLNSAEGESQAIMLHAEATAKNLSLISNVLKESSVQGTEAISLLVAQQYLNAFGNVAKEGTTLILPNDSSNIANVVGQALTMHRSMKG